MFRFRVNSSSFLLSVVLAIAICLSPTQATRAQEQDVAQVKIDPSLSAKVPQYYREKGRLVVGVNPDTAPIKFIDNDGNIVGFTPDLLTAAAGVLGLKLDLTQASFDSLIPGMKANRFDVLLSIADFKSRQNAVTFIDYLNMGETVVAPADKDTTLTALDNMCGLRVAFAKGSGVQPEGDRISGNCVKQGKQPMVQNVYPDDNLVFLSLTTGASDVAWVDSPEGYYNTKKFPTKYKVIFFTYKAPYGIGFGVDDNSKQLASAMQQALLKLQKDGTYEKLLNKWGLQAKDGLPTFPINGATSH